MIKKTLRNEMLGKMKKQTVHDITEKSGKIMHRLTSLDSFKSADDVFVYLSSQEEVSTDGILKHSLNSGKHVYAPVIVNDKIVAGVFDGNLKKGKFGIMEPMNKSEKTSFDLILVPGVVFDRFCARIGRGGGYFDKFLSITTGKKIGLAFDFQVVEKIPSETHDIILDLIVTEKTVLERL